VKTSVDGSSNTTSWLTLIPPPSLGARTLYSPGSTDFNIPYHAVPSIIAVNMIMSVATGGTAAIIIAVWAQVRYRTQSVNASEIANGILSALVAITAGCPFVDYWGACLIGCRSLPLLSLIPRPSAPSSLHTTKHSKSEGLGMRATPLCNCHCSMNSHHLSC